ncbi:MAG: thiopurine S-methyltransferase [Candidatus Omnitrophica bacterium]|nr:thiopurine S-methyltransferase [Candidatus Omnitrophota bacterium]MCB9721912.1 thiopurine S-methyltransferase [Candidatus Omnitrophota bacterium]
MDPDFWHQRWESNNIAFHADEVNPALIRYFSIRNVPAAGRVFVPLCGKTLDIGWLLAQGYRVAGAELSPTAIEQLFRQLAIKPSVTQLGVVRHYAGPGIDIYVGDIFQLTAEIIGSVDAVYDRAALVALPADMRRRYTAHLMEMTAKAPQLLLSFEYDQSRMEGPPFSVPLEEVQQHYAKHFTVRQLDVTEIRGGLKGVCPAKEIVVLLDGI